MQKCVDGYWINICLALGSDAGVPVLSSARATVAVTAGVPSGSAGAYTVGFTSTVAGSQILTATVAGESLGAGSFAVRILPAAADASKAVVSGKVYRYCPSGQGTHFEPSFLSWNSSNDVASNICQALVSGPGVSGAVITAGQPGRVTIASRDIFGNSRAGRFDTFAYAISTDNGYATRSSDGTYEIVYIVTVAGTSSLALTLTMSDGTIVSPATAVVGHGRYCLLREPLISLIIYR